MQSLSTQHHVCQSFSCYFLGLFHLRIVTRLMNFRQTVYLNMNYNFLTTMNKRDSRIHIVVMSNRADKVNYNENYFKQKL